MITELNRTPITWKGKDGWEVLVQNDCPHVVCVCELCMYRDWNGWRYYGTPCRIMKGCGSSLYTYFIFKKS